MLYILINGFIKWIETVTVSNVSKHKHNRYIVITVLRHMIILAMQLGPTGPLASYFFAQYEKNYIQATHANHANWNIKHPQIQGC